MTDESPDIPFTIARLTVADAADYRDLRLEGLRAYPEAFIAAWDEEETQSQAQFAERLESAVVFGARDDGHDRLAAVLGVHVPEASKIKHKATLFGLYVRPFARQSGLGAAMMRTAIAHAALSAEEILLTVTASDASAIRIYEDLGFCRYGLEQRALKVGERYYDTALMSLVLPKP